VGVLRRDPVTLNINYDKNDTTHTALLTSLKNGDLDGFRVRFPTVDGSIILFSGYLTGYAWDQPVDGVSKATITLRPSGKFMVNGVVFG
jgi:hypothetical protein